MHNHEKLRLYIDELKKLRMLNLDEFKADRTAQLAAERAFHQAATECCCDIGNHLIATVGLQQPDEQRQVFPGGGRVSRTGLCQPDVTDGCLS